MGTLPISPPCARAGPDPGSYPGEQVCAEGKRLVLISNDTQDDIIALVVFGFTLAIIVGVLGYVIGRFNKR